MDVTFLPDAVEGLIAYQDEDAGPLVGGQGCRARSKRGDMLLEGPSTVFCHGLGSK